MVAAAAAAGTGVVYGQISTEIVAVAGRTASSVTAGGIALSLSVTARGILLVRVAYGNVIVVFDVSLRTA